MKPVDGGPCEPGCTTITEPFAPARTLPAFGGNFRVEPHAIYHRTTTARQRPSDRDYGSLYFDAYPLSQGD